MVVAGDQRDQRLGQVAGEGGAADLVVDHPQLVALAPSRSIVSTKLLPPGPKSQDERTMQWRGLAAAVARSPASFERP